MIASDIKHEREDDGFKEKQHPIVIWFNATRSFRNEKFRQDIILYKIAR